MLPRRKIVYRKMFRRADIAALSAIAVGYAATVVLLLILLREFILALTGGSQLEPMTIAALLGVTAIAHAALRMLEFAVPEHIGFRIVKSMRHHIYQHMAQMMPHQIRHRSRGSLILRLTGDLTMLRTWLSRGIARGLIAGLSLVATLVMLARFSWPIALSIVVALILGAIASAWAGRRLAKYTTRVRRRRSTLTSNIDEQVHALASVQLFNRLDGERKRLERQNESLTSALIQEAWWRAGLRGLSAATSWLALVAALATGFILLRHGLTDLGTIVAALIATRLMQGYVTTLSLSHDYWRRAEISRTKLEDFFNSRSRRTVGDGDDKLVHNRARITFEDVYVEGALNGFSASVAAGRHVVIIGPDSRGREAVLESVTKMIEVDSGTVTIGQQDIAECSAESVWRKVGVISPDLPLMRGTLRRNLSYRDRKVDDEELMRLLGEVGLLEFVEDLPDGLDHWLTEGGSNLPADIRQLIRIVRGMAGNPPILLVERLGTALDKAQKATVQSVLGNFAATIISVSDDPSDICWADDVWTIVDGQLLRAESKDEHDLRVRLPRIARAGEVEWIYGAGR
ncbi:ABC transporter transmembrane domain-containing protein [Sphingomicrobium marinum]|uniref:ABC transporter transmembrane domain-containing protein n=1 Tax=Sphingomicrobium marinum TaxID=1227950 RepID=UPI00223F0979|nr:ABC transporter ATP-binding protein [Sphingomicrobium marinum]